MSRIQINSKDRNSGGTSDSFQLVLPEPLAGDYEVATVYIPNSLYNVTSSKNKIYIDATSVTITPGYYDASTLASTIQVAIRALGGTYASFTVVYSSITGKFTMANGTAFVLAWALSTGDDMAKVLGWNSTSTASATSQVSPNIASLLLSTGIAIRILEAVRSEFASSNQTTKFAVHVPIDQPFGSYMVWTPNSGNKQFVHFDSSKVLNVSLCGDDQQSLSLNGLEWSIILQKLV